MSVFWGNILPTSLTLELGTNICYIRRLQGKSMGADEKIRPDLSKWECYNGKT
jgi:hypothetical protein